MSKQGFKECYLVPRHLYDALVRDKRVNVISGLPDDVKIKLQDFNKRFNLVDGGEPWDGVEAATGKDEIISSVSDYSKRKKAEDIVDFMLNNSAGAIKWDKNFNIILDGQRLFGTDIRDLVRHLVGDTKGELDDNQKKVVSRLKKIEVLPHRLISQLQTWEPISSVLATGDSDGEKEEEEEEEEEEGDDWGSAKEGEDWDSEITFSKKSSGAATPPDSENSDEHSWVTLAPTKSDPGGDAGRKKMSILDSSSDEEVEKKKGTHPMITRGAKRKKKWLKFP